LALDFVSSLLAVVWEREQPGRVIEFQFFGSFGLRRFSSADNLCLSDHTALAALSPLLRMLVNREQKFDEPYRLGYQ